MPVVLVTTGACVGPDSAEIRRDFAVLDKDLGMPLVYLCKMDPSGQPSRSAAQRLRERRLRSMLRHERMSVAMALAEKLQHSSRGQRMARAGEGDLRDALHGHIPDASSSPRRQAPCTFQWT